MPDSAAPSATRFLGVRLTLEEEDRLEKYRNDRQLANRSAAIRALLRDAPGARETLLSLPVTRRRELEELVEDGYFTSVEAALEHALEAGLRELEQTHGEGLERLRRHARELRARGERRRRADREGRGLLGR